MDTFTAPDDDVSAVTNLEHTKDEGVGVGEEEEQEFEFRLFHSQPTQGSRQIKPSGKSQADHDNNGVQKLKIRMRSPTPTAPASGEGRFINPFRGWEYYFTDPELVIQTIGGNYSQQQSKQNTNDKQQRVPSKETFGDVAITGDQILASAASGPMVCLLIVSSYLEISFYYSLFGMYRADVCMITSPDVVFHGASYTYRLPSRKRNQRRLHQPLN